MLCDIFSITRLSEDIPRIRRSYPSGQIITDCPDGVPSVGFIESGSVHVYSTSLDGREVQLNRLDAGEHFGISNLLMPAELQTVLRCDKDTTVLYVAKSTLTDAMEKDSRLALEFAALCNHKLQFLLRRIEFLTMQTCRGKVIAYLLANKDENGRIVLHAAREALANHLGISRAALFRELSFLQSKGLIRSEDSCIYIENICRLEDILYR